MRFGPRGRVPAREWGTGPSIALVHGWGGSAAQLAPLAMGLAQHGYRAIAFDVAGHGESRIKEARWEWFIRDIAEVAQALAPLTAFVGHSAGALSMMASRSLKGVTAARYACICAPFYPYPPIRGIRERLNPGDGVLERYRSFLGQQFGTTWSLLEQGAAWQAAGAETLLFHDDRDRFVDPDDVGKVKSLCPGVVTTKTSGYGHTRILVAPELLEALAGFLRD